MAAPVAPVSSGFGFDPLSLGLTGIGLLGSLFGGEEELTDEQKRTYGALLDRSKG